VVRLAAPRTLELRWADDDWDEPTRMLFRLEEAADATRLTLEHSGREAFSTLFGEELNRAHLGKVPASGEPGGLLSTNFSLGNPLVRRQQPNYPVLSVG